jgi:hypothetical protein
MPASPNFKVDPQTGGFQMVDRCQEFETGKARSSAIKVAPQLQRRAAEPGAAPERQKLLDCSSADLHASPTSASSAERRELKGG